MVKSFLTVLICCAAFSVLAADQTMMKTYDTFTDDCVVQKVISPIRFTAKCENNGVITVKMKFLTDFASTKGSYVDDQADLVNKSADYVMQRYNLGKNYMTSLIGETVCVVTNSNDLYSKNGNISALVFNEYCNKAMSAERSLNAYMAENTYALYFRQDAKKQNNMMEKEFLVKMKRK